MYINRNTCLLCCITLPLISACAYSGYLPLQASNQLCVTSTTGAAANDCSLFSAGWLTYFWSGDFGGREQKSYEEMTVIFDDLADYLDLQRQKLKGNKEVGDLQQFCEKIRKNSPHIVKGMQNAGISSLHVEHITKKFFGQIYIILENTNFSALKIIGKTKQEKPEVLEMKM